MKSMQIVILKLILAGLFLCAKTGCGKLAPAAPGASPASTSARSDLSITPPVPVALPPTSQEGA